MAVKMSLEKLIQRGLTVRKFATPLHVLLHAVVLQTSSLLVHVKSCQVFLQINPEGLYQSAILKKNRKFTTCLCPQKSMKLGIFTSKKQTSFICCPLQAFYFSYEFLLVTRGKFHEIYYFIRCDHLSSFAMFK